MIHTQKFSPVQRGIIRKICKLQLESLQRLYEERGEHEEDFIMVLIEHDITKEEFKAEANRRITNFDKVHHNPQQLMSLTDSDMSIFRHILAHIEEEYKEKYPKAIANLWSRLFILDDFMNERKSLPNLN